MRILLPPAIAQSHLLLDSAFHREQDDLEQRSSSGAAAERKMSLSIRYKTFHQSVKTRTPPEHCLLSSALQKSKHTNSIEAEVLILARGALADGSGVLARMHL